MNDNKIILSARTVPVKQSELYEPMLYYGSASHFSIDYVSDIHLLHHIRYYNDDIRRTIRITAKSLYNSRSQDSVQLFLGDISSNPDVTIAFYRQYRLNHIYSQYKKFKQDQLVSTEDILALERRKADAKARSDILVRYIEKRTSEFNLLKREINKYVSYSKVIAPKGGLAGIKYYLESPYYKKRNLPCAVTEKIITAANLNEEIQQLFQLKCKWDEISLAEVPNEPVTIHDFKYQTEDFLGLVLIGNHEYFGFSDVDEAIKFYKEKLEPLGYIVLQNEFVESNDVVIYGGSGFAKYSERFNANNLICCAAMMGNRAYEIEQTTIFEKGYEDAKKYAMENGKCFICAVHYPVDSCLRKFDRETVYFTGHTHRNERSRTEDKVLYADNQIGYHNNGRFNGSIYFKQATTGLVRNPYADFKDGYYCTTPDTYLQFCDYIGEYIGEGKLIRKRCNNGTLYVIKSQGYYGFFIVSESGISIVNGGKTKKITLSKNFAWIYDNFSIVVNKYLTMLEPLRTAQIQISHELKRLGFDGTIHGLIVDIDYFNHIRVNPDGSLYFYFAPTFGTMQSFESFQEQIAFMSHIGLLKSKDAESKCNALALKSNVLVSGKCPAMMSVSRSEGIYGISRAISPLQRLFTGHVLRDFNLRLTEIENKNAVLRKRSMRGRVFLDKWEIYQLIVDDDMGDFIKSIDEEGKESIFTVQEFRSSIRDIWVTSNIKDTIAKYWKCRDLPESWREAIQLMVPEELESKK